VVGTSGTRVRTSNGTTVKLNTFARVNIFCSSCGSIMALPHLGGVFDLQWVNVDHQDAVNGPLSSLDLSLFRDTDVTLGMGGWLALTQRGLSPLKKRPAKIGAPTARWTSREHSA